MKVEQRQESGNFFEELNAALGEEDFLTSGELTIDQIHKLSST